jgi:hypothetical protein
MTVVVAFLRVELVSKGLVEAILRVGEELRVCVEQTLTIRTDCGSRRRKKGGKKKGVGGRRRKGWR